MRVIKLTPGNSSTISAFLKENNFPYFKPHSKKEKDILKILEKVDRDLYYGLFIKNHLIGYGMLRGMDEGYEIPSLGIAISKQAQSLGYGRKFMNFMESKSKGWGFKKIRLRVHKRNKSAIRLYTSLGYTLKECNKEYWLGIKELV